MESRHDRRGAGPHRQGDAAQGAQALSGSSSHSSTPRQGQDAEKTDWAEIAALERMQPSPVVTLNRAVAVSKSRGPAAGLAKIDPLSEALADYFHFHGLKGALLLQLDRPVEARDALGKAISLARSPVEADHIRQKLDGLANMNPIPVKAATKSS